MTYEKKVCNIIRGLYYF